MISMGFGRRGGQGSYPNRSSPVSASLHGLSAIWATLTHHLGNISMIIHVGLCLMMKTNLEICSLNSESNYT